MDKDCNLMTMPTGWCAPRCALHPAPAAAVAIISVVLLAATVRPALAQPDAPRGFVSVNGGIQTASSDFSDSVDFGHPLFGPEDGSFDASYPAGDDTGFDVGGGVRVWRNLALGANVSVFSRESDAGITGQLPHPFRFDRPRAINGTAAGVARTETAVHVQAQWVVPVGRSVAITLFGGPTWFNVTQDLVTGITFDQAYPYDEATFTGASAREQSASAIGVHVGADAAYYFSEWIGIGGTVRFSRGSVEFDSSDGGVAETDVGGVHTTAGLRIRF